MNRLWLWWLIGVLCLGLSACDSRLPNPTVADNDSVTPDDTVNPRWTTVMWNFPEDGGFTQQTFFDYPWPESRRYDSDGTLAMKGFPNPSDSSASCKIALPNLLLNLLLKALSPHDFRQYLLDVIDTSTRNFGNNGAIYFRFSGPLDEARLPGPEASIGETSPVILVNVEPGSKRRGEKIPVSLKLYRQSNYLQPNTLAILPWPGFPLAADSRYAVVIRRTLNDTNGQKLGPAPAFERLKIPLNSGSDQQHRLYAEVFDYLKSEFRIDRTEIAAMTVFRTGDPTSLVRRVAPFVESQDPQLANLSVTSAVLDEKRGIIRVSGTFNMLIMQRGAPPYLPKIDLVSTDFTKSVIHMLPGDHGGEIVEGKVQTDLQTTDTNRPRLQKLPFLLSIPQNLVTANGAETLILPVVLYSHGSGGSRFTAQRVEMPALAGLGMAVFSIDQVMHRQRSNPTNVDPDLQKRLGPFFELLAEVLENGSFQFNPFNLHAAQGNVIQSAIDYFWQAHFLSSSRTEIPISVKIGGQTLKRKLRFDPANIFFMGHSLGGLIGPFTAMSTKIRGMMLSAGSGHLISTLITKTKPSDPIDIKKVFDYLVCDGELTHHHPILTAAMTFFEPSDSINYARWIAKEPGRFGGKHLFLTQGLRDHYAPIETAHALSTAAFVRQVMPTLTDPLEQRLLGFPQPSGDLSGNISVGDKRFTVGFKEYHGDEAECPDDHFVYFCVPRAQQDWLDFFDSMLNQGLPVIRAGK